MLIGFHSGLGRRIALAQHRKQALVLVLRLVVEAFLIDREIARKLHHLAGGTQFVSAGRIAQGHGGAFELRGRHLAGHGALEDQVVKLGFVPAARSILAEIGRADRFVRFLRVLGLGAVEARFLGAIIVAEPLDDGIARGHDRAHVHLHAVGPHVGDRARFIERLRQPHGMAGGIAELARGLLLQRRGREGRRGVALQWLGLDVLDREAPVLDRLLRRRGAGLVPQRQLFQLLAVELHQPRVERRAVVLELGQHAPVFVRAEEFDLALAFADQPQRDRLHAARALGAGQPPPQHGAEREAIEIIERPACQIGVDQRLIELARRLHRLGNRRLGNGVEGDPIDLGGQRLALGQQLADMPGNRLALAVGVGREHEPRRLFGGVADLLEAALLVAIEFPVHREILVRADAAILGRQVADMAV